MLSLEAMRVEEGTSFSFIVGNQKMLVDSWPLKRDEMGPRERRQLTVLWSLYQEDKALKRHDTELLLTHRSVASLDEVSAQLLLFPRQAPYTLRVSGAGTLDQVDFRYRWEFVDYSGRVVYGAVRDGAFLTVGRAEYRLPESIYQLLEGMESFNAAPEVHHHDRLLHWARLRQWIHGDGRAVNVEGYLHRQRVVTATSFALDLYPDEDGNVTFDPVLVSRRVKNEAETLEEESFADQSSGVEHVLPEAFQEKFAHYFRTYRRALSSYVLDDGHIVILDKPLQRALTVVRRQQNASGKERRIFALNPAPYLSAALAEIGASTDTESAPEADDIVETVFVETREYSERVIGVATWQRKVIPWIQKPSEPWLPPEQFGIQIGGKSIPIEKSDLPELRQRIEEAIASGTSHVTYKGHSIPATEESLGALAQIVGEIYPDSRSESPVSDVDDPAEGPDRQGPKGKSVLQVYDNLEEAQFGYRPRLRRPGTFGAPDGLISDLQQHQLSGLEWLQRQWASGSPGALLADDMGLGKTLQALAFLRWVQEEMRAGYHPKAPCLVVAPTGLLKNWEDEARKHLFSPGLGHLVRAYGPDLRKLKGRGARASGGELDHGIPMLNTSDFGEADWVLTTYETLRDYQHSFGTVRWAVAVFDEAQKIKTPGTLITEAAKATNFEFALTMTGTPVENRLADLWCIVDTARPNYLGELKSFSRTYETEDESYEERLEDLKQKIDESLNTDRANPKVMLRRMKDDGLSVSLPPKTVHERPRLMPSIQQALYDQIVAEARPEGDDGASRQHILEVLHGLRSCSLHPYSYQGAEDDEKFISDSARLQETMSILDEVHAAREKALIFLESREFQATLQGVLQRRYDLPYPPMLINGTVSGHVRKRIVDEFEAVSGFGVLILSPKAGGVGLTITSANHVIHLSRWWNPAVEDQATDRVYRIGQTKPVHVYYPMSIHPESPEYSFDRRLHELIERKRQLSARLLMPPAQTPAELRQLFASALGSAGTREEPQERELKTVDLMGDGFRFEEWFAARLRDRGYEASITPRSRDGGVDVVAESREPTMPSWLIQCKHTSNPDRTMGSEPIQEVIAGKNLYSSSYGKEWQLAVVTNAANFSQPARWAARRHGVALVSRSSLLVWPPLE